VGSTYFEVVNRAFRTNAVAKNGAGFTGDICFELQPSTAIIANAFAKYAGGKLAGERLDLAQRLREF
jgi:hypothetical protein